MSIAKQLHQLQEIDFELESKAKALGQLSSQLGESQAVVSTRNQLSRKQQLLEELKKKQHSEEWEIDDLTEKIKTAEESLYSGRIKNPKELASLQQEVDILKSKRSRLEDKTLEIMVEVESAAASITKIANEVEELVAQWRSQQQQLSADIEQLKTIMSDIERERQLLSAGIEPQIIELYNKLKKQKGRAVAKVEQGVCSGCRILLPVTDLQRVRTGNLVQCSSCGRILFLY